MAPAQMFTVVFSLPALERMRDLDPEVREALQEQCDRLAELVAAGPEQVTMVTEASFDLEGYRVFYQVRPFTEVLRVAWIEPFADDSSRTG